MPNKFYAHTPPSEEPNRWHELSDHLRCVAAQAEKFAAKLKVDQLGKYAGLWHDLGKYRPEFQQYLEDCRAADSTGSKKKRRGPPHAVQGAVLAQKYCHFLYPIIYGHHSGLPDLETTDLEDARGFDSSEQAIAQAEKDLGNLYPEGDLDTLLEEYLEDSGAQEVLMRFLFSCLIDADHLDTEKHFEKSNAESRANFNRPSIQALWERFDQSHQAFMQRLQQTDKDREEVNVLRAEIFEACKEAAEQPAGIFRLAVPTGGGKTLSGLCFALRHCLTPKNQERGFQRVIVAVPYTSIIEQTVSNYRKMLGKDAVLEHHSAIKADKAPKNEVNSFNQTDEGAQPEQAQARLVTQNWDAPLVVTTTVQLFESLFSNRPSKCRKFHNLFGSVIILDEVQMLPLMYLQPIVTMLEELVERYSISIVLCTATQPVVESVGSYFQGFEAKTPYDIIPTQRCKQLFQSMKRVTYDTTSIQEDEAWSWQRLAEDLAGQHQALVILNTRKDALAVLDVLEAEVDDYLSVEIPEEAVHRSLRESKILHLSTLLCGAHRQAVLEEVKRRLKPEVNEPCLLVSTQVVEAGVDFDFPVVYRALGPLDRIVQAAGRCNREGARSVEESKVIVFIPSGGRLPKSGSEYALATQKAQQLISSGEFDLHDAEIFQTYFEDLYTAIGKKGLDEKQINESRKAFKFRKVAEDFKLIDDNSVPVVVLYNQAVKDRLNDTDHRGLWSSDYRCLQPYVVSLPRWEFEKARRENGVKPVGDSDSLFSLGEGLYHLIRGLPMGEDPGDWIYRAETMTQF